MLLAETLNFFIRQKLEIVFQIRATEKSQIIINTVDTRKSHHHPKIKSSLKPKITPINQFKNVTNKEAKHAKMKVHGNPLKARHKFTNNKYKKLVKKIPPLNKLFVFPNEKHFKYQIRYPKCFSLKQEEFVSKYCFDFRTKAISALKSKQLYSIIKKTKYQVLWVI